MNIFNPKFSLVADLRLIFEWSRRQPRPQGLLRDDFQNGGSSEEDPGKGWVTWYKISKNLGDFYHVTFQRGQNKLAAEVESALRRPKLHARGSDLLRRA